MNLRLFVVVLGCITSTIYMDTPPSPSSCAKALKLLKPFHHKKISCKMVGGMPIIKYKNSSLSSNLSCETIPGKWVHLLLLTVERLETGNRKWYLPLCIAFSADDNL